MAEVKFGYAIGWNDVREVIRQGILAEKYGFDSLWLPDHLRSVEPRNICLEPWCVLTALGLNTKNMTLASGVTDPLRRHPATTAQTVATLDQLVGGRATLGIGAGENMNLVPYGIEGVSAKRLKEAVECIKLLWTSTPEAPANYNGEFYQLKDAFLAIKPCQKPHPPIYIGALSPLTRRMVGEIANGWYPSITSPEVYKENLKDIEVGTNRVGRSIDEIDAIATVFTAVSRDYDEAKSAVEWKSKEHLVLERRTLERMGYGNLIPRDLWIPHLVPTKETMSAIKEAAKSIPMDAVEAISAFGTAEDCIDKIEEFLKVGSKHIVVKNTGPDVDETLRCYGEEIIPYFKQQRK